jgi:Glycosyl transferase family 8
MHSDLVKVFIGYDRRIPVAFTTLAHSITKHSSLPVGIVPINLKNIRNHFHRKADPLQSTEFSFSRFLTPFLSNYDGWSLFMDNDIVVREDIRRLWDLRDDQYAVMCVKHDHQPEGQTKFLGEKQTRYQKKNWSSVMLFNNPRCRALTPDYVNSATGLELHQFKWLEGDEMIGELPAKWNYLANCTKGVLNPSAIHYTEGGPYYPDYQNTEFAREWFEEFVASNHCEVASLTALTDLAIKHNEPVDA